MSHESTITSLYSLEGLTPHQYDDLDTHGFTIIHDVIDPEWLQELRAKFDYLVEKEGDNLAIEHHQEETVTRIANLINKGTVWEKILVSSISA